MVFEKAKLIEIDHKGREQSSNQIEFMFNPSEISFTRSMSIEQSKGARNSNGGSKPSFKHPQPYSLKISNIILDTYETGEDVLKYISPFQRGVEFSRILKKQKNSSGDAQGASNIMRPPVYVFTWGKRKYMHCFIKNLDFKLSLFLPDGTPVRASVNLSLEQVEVPKKAKGQALTLMGPQDRLAQGRAGLSATEETKVRKG